MNIISDPTRDCATPSKKPGGYEWWYFDALDPDSGYTIVVIFYEGNPFSNRYIRACSGETDHVKPNPDNFPAVSISVYHKDKPVYYSFTEFDNADADFDIRKPAGRAGAHHFEQDTSSGRLRYRLHLEEKLPSGDRLLGDLIFTGSGNSSVSEQGAEEIGHTWNLVLPCANVEGSLNIYAGTELRHDVAFSGVGYHDHNTGNEPMKDEFQDWYWGRFHFKGATLVYYAMNRREGVQHRAWLIEKDSDAKVITFDGIELMDESYSLFGLRTARKISMEKEGVSLLMQQSKLLDNGPFYQRYLSDAFLNMGKKGLVKAEGITEYIRPDRIYQKLFWPFVDMRIRYDREKPHWVQKSPRLYRWTW